jgi:hypothetical protein
MCIRDRPIRWLLIAAAVAALAAAGWAWLHARDQSHYAAGQADTQALWDAATAKANAETAAREAQNAQAAQTAAAAFEADRAAWAAKLQTRQQELRRATANLAACRLDDDAIRVLNDAARSASQPAQN